MERFVVVAAAAVGIGTAGAVADGEGPRTELTVYSLVDSPLPPPSVYDPSAGREALDPPGYAVVHERRVFELEAGDNEVRVTDLPLRIDPDTVRFASLTDPDGTTLLQQSYRFGVADAHTLLDRFLHHDITVMQLVGDRMLEHAGTLIGTAGGVTLLREDGSVLTLREYDGIRYPRLPDGLATRPALVWSIRADRGGEHEARVSYETSGIVWWAEYRLLLHDPENFAAVTLDLDAWVSVLNHSGTDFEDARLRLIAGDVQRVPRSYEWSTRTRGGTSPFHDASRTFAREGLHGYHMYTLAGVTSIADRSTRRLRLFEPAHGIRGRIRLVYEPTLRPQYQSRPATGAGHGARRNAAVQKHLSFVNAEGRGLGVPFPAGRVRVHAADGDGGAHFIGESMIDHTAREEPVELRIGAEFDVVAERNVLELESDSDRRVMEEGVEIVLRNRWEHVVDVVVREHMNRWPTWRIIEATDHSERVGAQTVEYMVRLAPDEERRVKYRVRYTW